MGRGNTTRAARSDDEPEAEPGGEPVGESGDETPRWQRALAGFASGVAAVGQPPPSAPAEGARAAGALSAALIQQIRARRRAAQKEDAVPPASGYRW